MLQRATALFLALLLWWPAAMATAAAATAGTLPLPGIESRQGVRDAAPVGAGEQGVAVHGESTAGSHADALADLPESIDATSRTIGPPPRAVRPRGAAFRARDAPFLDGPQRPPAAAARRA